MPSPKSGTACTLVSPTAPPAAQAADNADPGEVSQIKADQRQTQSGKYGSVPVKPYTPPESDEDKEQKKHWIEITLVDEAGQPVAGEPYQITLPDQTVASGTTDEKGLARVDGIDSGSCQITFPNRDQEAWTPA